MAARAGVELTTLRLKAIDSTKAMSHICPLGEENKAEEGGLGRGVQYVHCAMHTCIMVKVGGNENRRKYVKT